MAAVSTVTNRRRILAGFMGMLFLCAMLFSAFYIAAESHHDCEGEDCPICACIDQCEGVLYRVSDDAPAAAAVLLPVLFLFLCELSQTSCILQETPVSRKVRLNN